MFDTSKDILNLALAIGSLCALFALAALFVYTALIVRSVYRAMHSVEGAFEAVKKFFTSIGERISETSALGKFAVDVVKLVEEANDIHKEGWKESAKKKKK